MSLRLRIALALAAIAAATTISVGIASYRATSTRLMEEIDSSLIQAWNKIEANPTDTVREPDLLNSYIVQVITPDGVVHLPPGRGPVGPGPGPGRVGDRTKWWSYDVVSADGHDFRLVSGIAQGPRWDGEILQVGRPLDENGRVLHDLKLRTMLLVVVVTAGAAALGWLIARSVTGPLARLTRAATDVEKSGRLDVEVPVGGNDEVGQLGAAFNGMLGALAASRDDQRRLVEDAGHELRTPLTSVRTNLAVLRRHPDLDPQTRANILEDLHAETEELVGLVEEVVSLARGSTDGTPPEPIGLAEMASVVARRAERRHSRPVTVVSDDSVVEAPPAALERAISNLVDNAAKFDAGNGPIEIQIAAGRLVVLDRGPGISTADAGRLFDRFYRAADARALPGSGLGLSIVRDVVERAGGHVEAAQRPGGGAIVGFSLPLQSASDDAEGIPVDRHVPDQPWSPPAGLQPPAGDETAAASPARGTTAGTDSSLASGP
jgi:two-component system, OmpR family, sensor histidine kinase MprB